MAERFSQKNLRVRPSSEEDKIVTKAKEHFETREDYHTRNQQNCSIDRRADVKVPDIYYAKLKIPRYSASR